MIRLNFSICGDSSQDTPILHQLLDTFQKSSSMPAEVEVYPIPWESYRQELTSMVIHNRSGDVSQAGAPVASDMMAMNALRPFKFRDVERMGGKAAFLPVAWRNNPSDADGQIWAVPWLADPRVFFYWRDLVEQTQVDESTAFGTPSNLIEAVKQMQKGGISKPWGITVGNKHSALHTVASWVWACGGDFISEDGSKALILEPEAMEGFKAYFSMVRFMAPETLSSGYAVNNQLFANRQSAIILGNGETAKYILDKIPAGMQSRLGVALPFGVPLVGGSNLMIWAGTRHEENAVSLVQFLTGPEAQAAYPISIDHLPVRLDVLSQPPFTTDPILKGFAEALRRGRIFPIARLSGLLEERLGYALVNIWTTLFGDPSANLEDIITNNLGPVVRHYNNWME